MQGYASVMDVCVCVCHRWGTNVRSECPSQPPKKCMCGVLAAGGFPDTRTTRRARSMVATSHPVPRRSRSSAQSPVGSPAGRRSSAGTAAALTGTSTLSLGRSSWPAGGGGGLDWPGHGGSGGLQCAL